MSRRRLVAPALLAVGLAAALTPHPVPLAAQDRLFGTRALTGGLTVETVRFGGQGLIQGAVQGGDSIRVQQATQFSLPVSAAFTLGRRWTLDVTSVVATGQVRYRTSGGSERTATLSGPSDVRARATGRFLGDALVLTVGVNAPTGPTQLDAEQLTALRILAAPALAMGTPAVGAGPSGVLGLLSMRRVGAWVVAGGAAYELRGQYQPVAALAAGAPRLDLQPGNALRFSASVEGPIGPHRLAVTGSSDYFFDDVLRSPVAGDGADASLATVTLGPVMGIDAQLQLAVPAAREVVLWTAGRYRAAFARNGFTVRGSDGVYVEAGSRARLPIAPARDLVLALDGRLHTGLAIDQGLATSGVTSTTATLGVAQRVGRLSVQPFVRGTLGSARARGGARERLRSDFTGLSTGLVIIARF